MAGLLNNLGRTILPKVFSSLNRSGIVDTMTITTETAATIGTGGERIKGTAADLYEDVPVSYEPTSQGKRLTSGDKNVSTMQYTLTFPAYTKDGNRIELDPKMQRLVVDAREDEPAKTFRMIGVGDISGVVFEVICEREG